MYKGIYKITNKINGKMYIGSSKNVFKRWGEHISQLDNNIHHSWKLQKDWEIYNYTDFTFEILELLTYKDDLLKCEQKWLNEYESFDDSKGYNIMNYTKGEYISVGKSDIVNEYDFYNTIDKNTKILLKTNLKILDDKINNIGDEENALSKSWLLKASVKLSRKLGYNLRNYFDNKTKFKAGESYWTTFISSQSKVSNNRYNKSFIVVNGIAEEKRNNLCFMLNSYINPFLDRELRKKGITVDKEGYSLSILLNWILNVSNINKEIYIYIPSSRMRNLLIGWLDNDIAI